MVGQQYNFFCPVLKKCPSNDNKRLNDLISKEKSHGKMVKNYDGYPEASAAAVKLLKPSSGMSWDQLDMMRFWITGEAAGYPDENRRLNTCLSFWTYSRYIQLLYAKQSYTASGKNVSLLEDRKTAWLEPAPELYVHIQNQASSLISYSKNSQSADTVNRLKALIDIMKQCRSISVSELRKERLDAKEIAFLNDLDEQLLKLTGSKDTPIVTDVHTEPTSGKVLEEAIGFPETVIKEINGKKHRGALFTYYEFKYPMTERLTPC